MNEQSSSTSANAVPPKLLTIGGSDSGGAAGLQADLKTWTAQLEAVLSDYGADAAKTGFLGRSDLIIAAAAKLQQYRPRHIVVDPVLVNHQGVPMFSTVTPKLYLAYLLPLADLITPNRAEAALLLNSSLPDSTHLRWLEGAARRLHQTGAQSVLIKGGRDGNHVVDLLFDGRTAHFYRSPRLDTINTHGAGDTLSAAVCAFLARGEGMETAVANARQFTYRAMQKAANWQLGQGHGPLAHW